MSSISNLSPQGQGFLSSFQENVNVPFACKSDCSIWRDHLQNVLNNRVDRRSKDDLTKQAQILSAKYNHPEIGARTNHIAIQTLRREMKATLEKQVEKLQSLEAFQSMLQVIPDFQIESFLKTIHSHFNISGKTFSEALAYALSRSLIEVKEFEGEESLKRYICPIRGDLIESQPVYIDSQIDSQELPRQCYHGTEIRRWLRDQSTDPMTRNRKTISNLKGYPEGKEKVHGTLNSLVYPDMKIGESHSSKGLPPPSFFQAACIGYPIAKEVYQKVRRESGSYEKAAKEAEKILFLSIELFFSVLGTFQQEDLRSIRWIFHSEPQTAAQRIPSFSLPFETQDSSLNRAEQCSLEVHQMKEFLATHVGSSDSLESLKSQYEEFRSKLEKDRLEESAEPPLKKHKVEKDFSSEEVQLEEIDRLFS